MIQPRRPGLMHGWREFWRHWRLVLYFGQGILLKRYTRTFLGWLWLPLRPGMNLATRIFVFGGLVGISTGNIPYPIFFVSATASWTLFSETAIWSMRSLELNRKLLKRNYAPRLTVISSGLVPGILECSFYIGFTIIGLLYYYVHAGIVYVDFGWKNLLVPAGLVLLALLGVGVGMMVAGLGAKARDVRFLFGYVMGFVYFLTPVIYALSTVPPKLRPIVELNPLTGAVEMVKEGLFFSAHDLSPDGVLVTLLGVFLLWVPGLWLIDRREVATLEGKPARSAFRLRPGGRKTLDQIEDDVTLDPAAVSPTALAAFEPAPAELAASGADSTSRPA